MAALGILSYGTNLAEMSYMSGDTGRLLNGERPADLPVQQATKVELIKLPRRSASPYHRPCLAAPPSLLNRPLDFRFCARCGLRGPSLGQKKRPGDVLTRPENVKWLWFISKSC